MAEKPQGGVQTPPSRAKVKESPWCALLGRVRYRSHLPYRIYPFETFEFFFAHVS